MDMLSWFKKHLLANYLLVTLIIFYILVFGTMSLLRHWSLHSTYFDLGYETQSIWTSTQNRPLDVSFGPKNEVVSSLASHVNPILFLFTPIYSLLPYPETMLFIQTILLSLGAIPIFLLAQKKTRSKYLSYAVTTAYLLYPPLQYTNLFDFHPVALSTPLLLFTLYFGYLKKKVLFCLFAILAALTHEEIPLAVGLMGLYFVFANRWRYLGLTMFGLGVFGFLGNIFLIMPMFAKGTSVGPEFSRYSDFGNDPKGIILNFFFKPQIALKSLIIKEKIMYLFHLFISAGFFPILAPWSLLPALPSLGLNLFSNHNPMYQVKFHYTSAITPFIFQGTILALGILKKKISVRVLSAYLILISLLYNIAHSPSPLFYKFDPKKYQVTAETWEVLEILKTIPPEASVSAMNNLGAHVSNRKSIALFPINYDTSDFVAVDPQAVKEDFDLSQIKTDEFEEKIESLKQNPDYKLKTQNRHLLLFEKVDK